MRISFDLDETLFIDPRKNDIELPLKFPFSFFYREKLRKGAVLLLQDLLNSGHELYVYTTSFRSIRYIKSYFKKYKIIFHRIINGDVHQKLVQAGHAEILPSKYPPKFQIDLHVDDDKSVKENGKVYGFDVLILEQDDKDWVDKVKKKIAGKGQSA